jgi:hypothetical protein
MLDRHRKRRVDVEGRIFPTPKASPRLATRTAVDGRGYRRDVCGTGGARGRGEPDHAWEDDARWIGGRGGEWNSFAFLNDPDGNGWILQERPRGPRR